MCTGDPASEIELIPEVLEESVWFRNCPSEMVENGMDRTIAVVSKMADVWAEVLETTEWFWV